MLRQGVTGQRNPQGGVQTYLPLDVVHRQLRDSDQKLVEALEAIAELRKMQGGCNQLVSIFIVQLSDR